MKKIVFLITTLLLVSCVETKVNPETVNGDPDSGNYNMTFSLTSYLLGTGTTYVGDNNSINTAVYTSTDGYFPLSNECIYSYDYTISQAMAAGACSAILVKNDSQVGNSIDIMTVGSNSYTFPAGTVVSTADSFHLKITEAACTIGVTMNLTLYFGPCK
jgi:hypothetical protein